MTFQKGQIEGSRRWLFTALHVWSVPSQTHCNMDGVAQSSSLKLRLLSLVVCIAYENHVSGRLKHWSRVQYTVNEHKARNLYMSDCIDAMYLETDKILYMIDEFCGISL